MYGEMSKFADMLFCNRRMVRLEYLCLMVKVVFLKMTI